MIKTFTSNVNYELGGDYLNNAVASINWELKIEFSSDGILSALVYIPDQEIIINYNEEELVDDDYIKIPATKKIKIKNTVSKGELFIDGKFQLLPKKLYNNNGYFELEF